MRDPQVPPPIVPDPDLPTPIVPDPDVPDVPPNPDNPPPPSPTRCRASDPATGGGIDVRVYGTLTPWPSNWTQLRLNRLFPVWPPAIDRNTRYTLCGPPGSVIGTVWLCHVVLLPVDVMRGGRQDLARRRRPSRTSAAAAGLTGGYLRRRTRHPEGE